MDDPPREGTKAHIRFLEECRPLASSLGPEKLAILEAKIARAKVKYESRYGGRMSKSAVMHRAENKCEICTVPVQYIGHIHHVIPVRKGGTAEMSNLILLCPTCHDLAHMLSRKQSQTSLVERAQWAMEAFGEDRTLNLYSLSTGELKLIGGKWTAVDQQVKAA